MTESSRSRAYPALHLSEAIEVLRKQVEGLGPKAHDRHAIAQALEYTSGSSGAAARKIAALVHFGLLERHRGLYKPTELAKSILEGEDDPEKNKGALRRAFLHPSLFREIVDEYQKAGQIPRLLAHTLRDYRIASNARDEVARIFMESGQYAQVVDAAGVFETDYLASVGLAPTPARVEEPDEWGQGGAQAAPAGPGQILRLYLTDGKVAELRLPLRLNDQDLAILRKQLDVLETQVQVNKPAPPLRWGPRKDRSSQA